MSTGELWFNIIQITILVLGFLGVGLIPKYFYEKKLNNLRSEIKNLNISLEQNHPVKMERYKDFVENFFEYGKISNQKQQEKKLSESFKSISNAVFLFGSDESMKAFLTLRDQPTSQEDNYKALANGAKFMVELRKDLNGGKTDITAEDYLKMILNDWDKSKYKIKKYL